MLICMNRRHRSARRLTLVAAATLAVPLALVAPTSAGASDAPMTRADPGDESEIDLTKDEIAAIDELADQASVHGYFIMRMSSSASCRAGVRYIRAVYGWSAHCHGRNLWVIF